MLHVAGVDVVSLQQAAVAGALQGELRTQERNPLSVTCGRAGNGHVQEFEQYQLLQVLLGESRVSVPLLLELVPGCFGHYRHPLGLETGPGLARGVAHGRVRGVQVEPTAGGSVPEAHGAQDRAEGHPDRVDPGPERFHSPSCRGRSAAPRRGAALCNTPSVSSGAGTPRS